MYRPRRARAAPPYRLLEDHFQAFTTIYDERFAPRRGRWRPVIAAVVEKFLACGILEHGFAQVRRSGSNCMAAHQIRRAQQHDRLG